MFVAMGIPLVVVEVLDASVWGGRRTDADRSFSRFTTNHVFMGTFLPPVSVLAVYAAPTNSHCQCQLRGGLLVSRVQNFINQA